jgi:hypothetical protein
MENDIMSKLTAAFCSSIFSKKTKLENCLLGKWEEFCVVPFHSIRTSKNTDQLIKIIKNNNDFNDINKLTIILTAINVWRNNKGESKRESLVIHFENHIRKRHETLTTQLKLTQQLNESTIPAAPEAVSPQITNNLFPQSYCNLELPKLIDDGVIRNEASIKELVNPGYVQHKKDIQNVYRFMPEIKSHNHIQIAPKEKLSDFYEILHTLKSNIQYLFTHHRLIDTNDHAAVQQQLQTSFKEVDNIQQVALQKDPTLEAKRQLKLNKENGTRFLRTRTFFHSYILIPFTSLIVDIDGLLDSLCALSSIGMIW